MQDGVRGVDQILAQPSLEHQHRVVERDRVVETERPDRRAAEAGEVSAHAQRLAEVVRERAHVEALAALDLDLQFGRLARSERELIDRDRSGLELRLLAAPGRAPGAFAVDLHRAEGGRQLHQLAAEGLEGVFDVGNRHAGGVAA